MTTPQTDAPTLRLLKVPCNDGTFCFVSVCDGIPYVPASTLDAHEATISALVEAGDALARQAFCTMTGGHGHLIDDMCAAIAKAAALK